MWLTFRSGDRRAESVEVAGERFLIGRGEDCALVLHDDRVSRHHAVIVRREDGSTVIEDLGSANGTYVEGIRIDAPVHLVADEQIQLGDTVLATSRERPSERAGATVVEPAPRSEGSASTLILEQEAELLERERRVERRLRRVAVLAAGGLLAAGAVGAFLALRSDDDPVADVVERVRDSTVLVQSVAGGRVVESGSGWVLDAREGLIVTNAHVINGGERFLVGNAAGLRAARISGAAPCEDLAVLSVADRRGLRTLPLGRQDRLRLGQTLVAVGYPANASREAALTSTTGVVSVARSAYREPALDIPAYPNVVQTDAAINPGSSGGPLVDLDGRLAGVNSAGRTITPDGRIVQGQGYAIGVDRVREIVPVLRSGRSIAWTGASFDWPTRREMAGARRPGLRTGAAVDGTAAAGTALGRPGSRITAIDGTPVGSTLVGYCDAIGEGTGGRSATFEVVAAGPAGAQRAQRVRVRFE